VRHKNVLRLLRLWPDRLADSGTKFSTCLFVCPFIY